MADDVIKLGDLTINRLTLVVEWREQQLELEPKWVQVLITLAEAPNNVLTREQIINNVWADYLVGEDSLNRAISKLRKALEPVQELSIATVRGIGYQLTYKTPDATKKERIERPGRAVRLVTFTIATTAVIIVSFMVLQSKQVPLSALKPDIDHVTSDLGIEFAPDISPDNKYMAYTWNGGNSGKWNIYIKQIGIEGSKRLTNNDGFDLSPAWSNSGDKIAFFQGLSKGWQLNIRTFLGTEQRIITEVSNIWKNTKVMDWGAGDKTLVYSAMNKGDDTYTINKLNLNDLSIKKLIADPDWDFTLPRFSPDHSLLATVGQRGVRNFPQASVDQLVGRLIIIDTATGEVIFEREASQEISSIVWKNNTELLLTIANCIDCPVYQINILEESTEPIAHGNMEQILTVSGIVRNIAYHRKSGDLYLEKWQADVNIWSARYTLDKLEENKLLFGSTLIDFSPKLNPDESKIAYISNRSNSTQVWIYDLKSGESRQLSNKKSNRVIKSIEWSHDGENIVLSLQDQDKKIHAMIIDLQGNELRQIEWKKSIHKPVYAADDESLFAILYDEEHLPAIWQFDLKSGKWEKFAEHLASSVCATGDYLYFTRPDKNGLWRMSYDNPLMVETVTDRLKRTRMEYWTIHGDTLKMLNSEVEKNFLEMIHIPTQQQISRIRMNNYIPITEASATFSSNNEVYFSSIDNYDADIVKVRLGENLDQPPHTIIVKLRMSMKEITLGSWTIQPHSNSIANEQGTIQLEPLVMKMLIILAERPNQVITRQELMDHLWGDTVVSNDSLNRIASQLRRIFQEDELVAVATIRGIGYRLTASSAELPAAKKKNTTPGTLNVVAITLLSALGLVIVLYLNWSPEPEEASNPELAEYTQLPGFLLNPQISPNDDILLFSWNGGQGSKFNIYLKREGATLPTRLSEGSFDLAPIWSPEGDFVAYNAFDFATGKSNLHIQPLVGQSLRVVKDFQVLNGASPLDWSPDGKTIAASAIMPGKKETGIYLVNVEDLSVSALTKITDDSISHNTPRFSPDGEKMVFVRMNARENRINYNYSTKNSLKLIDLKTKEEQTLVESFMDPFGIEWLDNETIIYVNRQNGRSRVVSYSLKTGESEEIFSRANVNLKGFDLFHKSRKMVIEAQKSDFNVEVATLGDSTVLSQKPIIEFTSLDFSPVRDSAGKLYYISGYSGIEQIWTLDSEDQKANQLTYFNQGKLLGNLTLSPAENQLAYSVKNSNHIGRIELISTDGTQRDVILEGKSDYAYPSWSLDGESLYFYSDSLTTPQVFRMDLATRKIEQITWQQAIYGKETERGFFFVKFNIGGIWQLHEDGREEMIIDDLSFLNVSDWIIEDNTLIYLRTQNNKPAIVFFDLDKKEVTREVAVPKLRMTLPSMGISFNLKDNEIYYTSATSFTSALNTLAWQLNPYHALENLFRM